MMKTGIFLILIICLGSIYFDGVFAESSNTAHLCILGPPVNSSSLDAHENSDSNTTDDLNNSKEQNSKESEKENENVSEEEKTEGKSQSSSSSSLQTKESVKEEDAIEISKNKEEFKKQKLSQLDDSTSKKMKDKLFDEHHGIKMGVPWYKCDDGHRKIEIDWDGNTDDYTCLDANKTKIEPYLPSKTVPAIEIWVRPPLEMSTHWCLQYKLEYKSKFPIFGPHRPLWAKFGSYTHVPPQRWLHNLEHGAIVFLYHPCAKKELIDEIALIITSCMRKYVIAADTKVSQKRPLMLLAWGAKYQASDVNEYEIVSFIRRKAMRGPESLTVKDGFYEFGLLNHSSKPVPGSDWDETNLCPTHPNWWI